MATTKQEPKIVTRRQRKSAASKPKGLVSPVGDHRPNYVPEARTESTQAFWLDDDDRPTPFSLSEEKREHSRTYERVHLWLVASVMTNFWLAGIVAIQVWG